MRRSFTYAPMISFSCALAESSACIPLMVRPSNELYLSSVSLQVTCSNPNVPIQQHGVQWMRVCCNDGLWDFTQYRCYPRLQHELHGGVMGNDNQE